MLKLKTKLEVLKDIVRSNKFLATEKFCIFSTMLPKEIERDIVNQVKGMVDMAELLLNKGI